LAFRGKFQISPIYGTKTSINSLVELRRQRSVFQEAKETRICRAEYKEKDAVQRERSNTLQKTSFEPWSKK
jgi:hypothetical protein